MITESKLTARQLFIGFAIVVAIGVGAAAVSSLVESLGAKPPKPVEDISAAPY